MKKFLLIILMVMAGFWSAASPAFAQTPLSGASSAVLKSNLVEADNRAQILAIFLTKENSPLALYAEEFVEAADFYGIDWRLVPAITGVESTFGKQIPFASYNAYGWNNGDWKFKSWKDSIWYVTGQLKTRYLDRGYVSVSQIGRIYAPPSPFWAGKVKSFLAKIEATSDFTLDL